MTIYCATCDREAAYVVASDYSEVYQLCEQCWNAFTLGQSMEDADMWDKDEYITNVMDIAYDMGIRLSSDRAKYLVENLCKYGDIIHGIRKMVEDMRDAEAEAWADLQMDK